MKREIESVAAFSRALRDGAGALHDVVVQGLDLRSQTEAICGASVERAVFLGCQLEAAAERDLLAAGALLFPPLPGLVYQPYRPSLYAVEELYEGYRRGEGESLADSLDQQIYRHYRAQRDLPGGAPIIEALAQRLHDHAIDDALEELLAAGPDGEPRRVVAIMGGHAMSRRDPAYREVALIGQLLAEGGYLPASGGGPGAMEATHLGAHLAHHGEAAIDQALELLVDAPTYKDPGWLDGALAVRERYAAGAESLGIPTWFYGHEPPNALASHVAKYFSNSLREDGLLAIAHHGVIFAPGSAGTIQEIFMDAAQNHYATFGDISPMVFFGRDYWSREKPIYPLLSQLAAGQRYGELLSISDDPAEIVSFIVEHPPIAPPG